MVCCSRVYAVWFIAVWSIAVWSVAKSTVRFVRAAVRERDYHLKPRRIEVKRAVSTALHPKSTRGTYTLYIGSRVSHLAAGLVFRTNGAYDTAVTGS